MGFLRRAILGGAAGAGVGYYNAAEGRGWRGAAIGGMAGAAVGGIGGGMALKGGRALAGRARGMVGSAKAAGGRLGSKLRSNRPVNSFRDPVLKQVAGKGPRNKLAMPTKDFGDINLQTMTESTGQTAQRLWGGGGGSRIGFSPGWKSAAV